MGPSCVIRADVPGCPGDDGVVPAALCPGPGCFSCAGVSVLGRLSLATVHLGGVVAPLQLALGAAGLGVGPGRWGWTVPGRAGGPAVA